MDPLINFLSPLKPIASYDQAEKEDRFGLVKKFYDERKVFRVRWMGTDWDAHSLNGPLSVGDIVYVESRRGNRIKVRRIGPAQAALPPA